MLAAPAIPPLPVLPAPLPIAAPFIPIVASQPAEVPEGQAAEAVANENTEEQFDNPFHDPVSPYETNEPDSLNLDLIFQEPEQVPTVNERQPKPAALEARDRNHANKVQFIRRVQLDKQQKTVKASVKRAKQTLLRNRRNRMNGKDPDNEPGPSTINSIETPKNVIIVSGNILMFPGAITHCVSRDF